MSNRDLQAHVARHNTGPTASSARSRHYTPPEFLGLCEWTHEASYGLNAPGAASQPQVASRGQRCQRRSPGPQEDPRPCRRSVSRRPLGTPGIRATPSALVLGPGVCRVWARPPHPYEYPTPERGPEAQVAGRSAACWGEEERGSRDGAEGAAALDDGGPPPGDDSVAELIAVTMRREGSPHPEHPFQRPQLQSP